MQLFCSSLHSSKWMQGRYPTAHKSDTCATQSAKKTTSAMILRSHLNKDRRSGLLLSLLLLLETWSHRDLQDLWTCSRRANKMAECEPFTFACWAKSSGALPQNILPYGNIQGFRSPTKIATSVFRLCSEPFSIPTKLVFEYCSDHSSHNSIYVKVDLSQKHRLLLARKLRMILKYPWLKMQHTKLAVTK